MPGLKTIAVTGARCRWRVISAATPCAIAIVALSGCASLRQTDVRAGAEQNEWAAVVGLETGSTIRVEDAAGAAIEGEFVRAGNDDLTIAVGSGAQTLFRATVQRLLLLERRTAQKAKRGWLVATVAGGLVGALATKSNRAPWTLFMSAGWGAIGAGIGASDGFFDRKATMVYQASPVMPAKPIGRGLTSACGRQGVALCAPSVGPTNDGRNAIVASRPTGRRGSGRKLGVLVPARRRRV